MKRIKKLLLLFLFFCLFLTGCTAATQENMDSAENNYTELTLFSDVSFWNPPVWSFEEGSISAGISKKTGAYLDFTIPPQDASKKLSLMILKDELPDLIVATDKNVINQLIRSGKVWSLQDFFETYCPDSHLLKDFPKDRKQEYIRQYGDWYAYLSHLNTDDARKTWKEKTSYYGDLFTHSYNHGIMFNRKLLARANLTVSDIQTASQILKAFEKVKKLTADDEQSTIPLLLEGNQYLDSSISCLIGSFGAEVIDDNGNYTERFLQPECKDAFAFLNTAFRKGYAFSEDLTLDNLQMRDLIADGRVFCYIGNTSNTSVDATSWVSAGPILSDSGKRPVMSIDLSVPTGWMQTFVSKSCKNPELVARFFDYMTSDEGLLYSNYGVENEDYTFDSDGYIQRTARGQQRFHDSIAILLNNAISLQE